MDIKMEQALLLCECSSSEHQLIIRYFKDDEYPEVYVDVHLTNRGFWGRLKYAVKYLFGYKSKYGAWDEVILGPQHINSLQSVIDHMKRVEAERLQSNSSNDGQDIHQ